MKQRDLNEPPNLAGIPALVAEMGQRPGALLPILHALQDRFGYIPQTSIVMIAEGLNLSRAEVHGVVSFYHFFRTSPPGRHVIQICASESCQATGGRALEAHARLRLGIDFHETTPDGEITLEPVYCLGNCACSPALRVNRAVLGPMDPQAFDQVLATLGSRDPHPKP